MSQHISIIVSNKWVNNRYKHMVVHSPEAAAIAKPGQFFHLLCSQAASPLMRRPMSIYRIVPERNEIHYLYHVKGLGTQQLSGLAEGDPLDMVGPLGQGFSIDSSWKSILLLARGVGLATLAPVTEMAAQAGVHVYAILSARTSSDVLSEEYMRSFGATVDVVTDEDGTSEVGCVREQIMQHVQAHNIDAFFTCGSKRLIQLLKTISAEYKIPGQVALEENMGCALGMCFCCVRPFRRDNNVVHLRVCKEGPVFPLAEVIYP